MNISLEPIHEENEPKPIENEPIKNEPKKEEKELTSIERKRLNKVFQCDICGQTMNKRTLLYHHNCQHKQTKPKAPPIIKEVIKEIPKEIIKEIPQEITDDHIKEYIQRKQQEHIIKAKEEQKQRFNRLMRNAF